MKFDRLRISGFKSFVDPTELLIPPGMTGVVGPNGCGKSNLLEALRWVMGETSYKNLRGSGMEDVIFSGSADRPSRNSAEVTVTLDNSERRAPAQFNDDDVLEVSRRIERDAGSAYHVNGRDARARDVQMLFADASTGAHSIALVRQGQIGEIISAKPQARRRILEEAAGISGLHHRRHEAELRLRAAETNLERLDDVVGEIENQLQALKRQARQANRYRNVAENIRRCEALLLHLKWTEATAQLGEAEAEVKSGGVQVETLTRDAAIAAHAELKIAETLPALRDAEAASAAGLQRLKNEDSALAAEAARTQERRRDLEAQITRVSDDLAREAQLLEDNKNEVTALAKEETELLALIENEAGLGDQAKKDEEGAAAKLSQSEAELGTQLAKLADLRAARANLDARVKELAGRATRIEAELTSVSDKITTIDETEDTNLSGFETALEEASRAVSEAETAATATETQLTASRNDEAQALELATKLANEVGKLEAEAAALVRLAEEDKSGNKRLLDMITVNKGYEQALVSALGDDLEAAVTQGNLDGDEPSQTVGWRALGALSTPTAPPHPELAKLHTLAEFVSAPEALDRRLGHIYVVETAESGAALQEKLGPGQRLVSRAGDLWRWDGFTALAGAATAASRRLEARNQLAELRKTLEASVTQNNDAASRLENARAARGQAETDDRAARDARHIAGKTFTQARERLDANEKATRANREKRIALDEARGRIAGDLGEAQTALVTAQEDAASQPDISEFEQVIAPLREAVDADRQALNAASSRAGSLAREATARLERRERISADKARWQARIEAAASQKETLLKRQTDAKSALVDIEKLPDQIAEKRERLASAVAEAEQKRKNAADVLAEEENKLATTQKDARAFEATLSNARETLARAEARFEAITERHSAAVAAIKETLSLRPEGALAASGHQEGDALPNAQETETKLARLKGDRERLGAVNLMAEDEAKEQGERLDTLQAEREDLEKAIRRLRQGISSLNSEARGRLLTAFESVNSNFRTLFQQLFGGGTAELTMTEADDPLDAGLEIVAKPPGKKPQVLTLLSGGEQALTAIALILAVFRTNPSPICVLDEVDAPLDDANVERFCNVIEQLARDSDTRFLVITHHAYSMARMDRLFGVTMAERGVSQLVSVDLGTAHSFREAG